MMKRTLNIFFFLIAFKSYGQLNIVPMPAEVKMGTGNFEINKATVIVLEGSHLEKAAAIFNEQLKSIIGYQLKILKSGTGKNAIVLNFERLDYQFPGAYNLTVSNKTVYIAGDNESGVFYGLQTLLQLVTLTAGKPGSAIFPQLFINDYPRFGYRGMHLDVCRHFFPVPVVKKYIDYLAAHKFNNFHWHLTEDQGWRIEIKKYPNLTQTGAYRNGTIIGRYPGKGNDNIRYGGFYTQVEIKEIVQYAADRYINVIPEIEMPGHATAALASYPFLGCTKGPYKVLETWGVLDDVFCAGNDSTFTFLENVLDEVMQLFPSKYIHIGGDECPKERWKTCPLCQKRIRDNHLKDEHELQSYFIERIEKYVNSKGRKIIGWDEILEGGLAKNATVMSWRGEEGGIAAAQQDHDVIMTPGTYCYFDHSQTKNEDSVTIGGYLPLEMVYGYEPIPAALNATQAKHILGAQANVWTEYISNVSKLQYMIFPRMGALSEVLWTPKKKRDWPDFERRLPALMQRYENWGANYSKAYYELIANVLPGENNIGLFWQLQNKDPSYFVTVNRISKLPYPEQIPELDSMGNVVSMDVINVRQEIIGDIDVTHQKIGITQPGNYSVNMILTSAKGKKTYFNNILSQQFSFNKATGKKITLVNPPNQSYPGNGAFTLVDGIQNESGLSRSNEFLGFLGKDLDATIDLGNTEVNKVTIHVLDQRGSWIYLPSAVEITYLPESNLTATVIATAPKETRTFDPVKDAGINKIVIEAKHNCRYLHVVVKNFGIIPSGNPGAGTTAWLFADEIEVE